MAYTTINKSSLHMNTKLYTGNGSTNAITGVGFQPDFIWCKARSISYDHRVFNSISGVGKYNDTGNTGGDSSDANSITAFGTDGFTLGSEAGANGSSQTFVSWNWLAGGTASSNTDGSITSSVSANTTAGFSISTYAGSGSLATIGHGLGVAPKVVLIKSTSHAENWTMYHASLGAGKYIYLNNSDAAGGGGSNTSIFNNTAPTSSVFTVNTDGTSNGSGKNYVAYCFAEKQGFSKFGSYVGNGNADGSFIYTGQKNAFIIIKNTSTAGTNWVMFDNKRIGYNESNYYLRPSGNNTESTNIPLDILSNGFKIRTTAGDVNTSGNTYIYMAFAEAPLVGTNNIPATAR